MVMFGMAVQYFLDELDGNTDKYPPNRKAMFSTHIDYSIIKELYNQFDGDKEEAKTIIMNVLDEFNEARKNEVKPVKLYDVEDIRNGLVGDDKTSDKKKAKKSDWENTYDHCCEIYETYHYDFTKNLLSMMYSELSEREKQIRDLSATSGESLKEIQSKLLQKGC